MNWQPIETAPKDGTYVLVYPGAYTKIPMSIARWDDDRYASRPRPYWRRLECKDITTSRINHPTHWAPMPEPPQEGEGDD